MTNKAIDNIEIGRRVRSRREMAGLSRAEVMRRMSGLGQRWDSTTCGRVERGDRQLTLAEAPRLAASIECSIDDLLPPMKLTPGLFPQPAHEHEGGAPA